MQRCNCTCLHWHICKHAQAGMKGSQLGVFHKPISLSLSLSAFFHHLSPSFTLSLHCLHPSVFLLLFFSPSSLCYNVSLLSVPRYRPSSSPSVILSGCAAATSVFPRLYSLYSSGLLQQQQEELIVLKADWFSLETHTNTGLIRTNCHLTSALMSGVCVCG